MTGSVAQAVQVSPKFEPPIRLSSGGRSACVCQGAQGVPLVMSTIHPECHDHAAPDRLVADLLLRQEPDEEEDEEEDEDERKKEEDDDDNETADGYSE